MSVEKIWEQRHRKGLGAVLINWRQDLSNYRDFQSRAHTVKPQFDYEIIIAFDVYSGRSHIHKP